MSSQHLSKLLSSQLRIPNEVIPEVTALFKPETLQRGDIHLRKGRSGSKLSFLLEGFLRSWVEVGDKEVTQWIFTPDYFVADLQCLLFDGPARFNVEALTEAKMVTLSAEDYHRLGEIVPSWPVLEKQFIGRCFGALEDRVLTLISLPARERYDLLFEHQPELFNQVPLRHLASMLGMTAETLSRLRR